MSVQNLKDALPDYAKDLKLNLSGMLNDPSGMNEQQLWGTIVASAMGVRNELVLREVLEEAASHLAPEALTAAKAAAAMMGMNNIYYRFVHLASNKEYMKMPAKLRMNIIGNPGVEKADFELWSLAVSAINGCGMCIDAHEKHLVDGGMGRETIQHAVRIASILHAIASVLEAEAVAPAGT